MAEMFGRRAADRQVVLPETARAGMAKADLRKPETAAPPDWRAEIATSMQRVVSQFFATNQLAAIDLKVDDSQFGKWMTGSERVQLDRLFADPRLRVPIAFAFCRMAGIRVEIVARMEHTA